MGEGSKKKLYRHSDMTISNYLTLLRILLIPVFVAILLDPRFSDKNGRIIAVVILAVASITDFLDGYLARLRNEVTRLGKLLDPIADKLLISAALISIVQLGHAPAWMIVVILGREFAVSGLRLIAAGEGVEISVSHYGKFKMVAQVFAVGLLIYGPETRAAGMVMLWIVLGLSVVSMTLYFLKFWIGMDPDRREQLSHRRTLKEFKDDVIHTTRSLREFRRERKKEKKAIKLWRRERKLQRRLAKARAKIRDLTGNSFQISNHKPRQRPKTITKRDLPDGDKDTLIN